MKLLVLILSPFLLTSCLEIDGTEEIWINSNGSGKGSLRYDVDLKMPKFARELARSKIGDIDLYRQIARTVDERDDNIKITKLKINDQSNPITADIEFTFNNVLKLLETSNTFKEVYTELTNKPVPREVSVMTGEIDIKWQGTSPSFTRQINLGEALPKMIRDSPDILGNSKLNYTIHFPYQIENTSGANMSNDGKTATWTFLLKDHINTPLMISAKTPLPWWIWVLIILSLLLLIRIVVWLFKKLFGPKKQKSRQ